MFCRAAAAQISLRHDSCDETIKGAQGLVREAAKAGAQIVCLPEHWLLEYWREAGRALDRLVETARAENIFVITGANYTTTRSDIRIRSVLIDPNGRIAGCQDKVHLFLDERKIAVSGKKYEIMVTPLGKLGITICYDNVFPEPSRTLTLRGVDLLFVPSRIISEGLDPWLLYLKTRALENRLPVVAPNVFHPPRYSGGSVIIDLEESVAHPVVLPKIVASAGAGERVIVADINIDRARELRSRRLSERMPAVYK